MAIPTASWSRMSHVEMPSSILTGFDLPSLPNDQAILLPGGCGTSYLLPASGVVLKPAHDVLETEILCNILQQVGNRGPYRSFQVYQPLRSVKGTFVYEGWSASKFIPDVQPLSEFETEYTLPMFGKILKASNAFHLELQNVVLSDAEIQHLRHGVNHVWSNAHRAVWSGQIDPQVLLQPFAPHAAADRNHRYVKLVRRLIDMTNILGGAPAEHQELYRTSSQIVHGDIVSGDNVLFPTTSSSSSTMGTASPLETTSPPWIIDLSPTFAPAAYAEGILLADGLIWYGVGLELVDLAGGPTLHRLDMLRRGLLFRCIVAIGLVDGGMHAGESDVLQIEKLTEVVEHLLWKD